MKKHIRIFSLLLLCVLLMGCTEELKDKTGSRAIRFGVQSGNRYKVPSRASIVESTEDMAQDGNSFAVWGHYVPIGTEGTGTSVFNATPVTYRSGQGWGYLGDERYWEPGNEYSFHVLYPLPSQIEGSSVTYAASGSGNLMIHDFNATQGIDLLYASRTGIQIADVSSMPSAVSLSFKHLLSRITFVAIPEQALTEAGITVTFTRVRIYGMSRSGSWNATSGSWTLNTDRTTATSPYASFADDIELTPEGTDLFAGNKAILMIPQTIGMEYYLELRYFYSGENKVYSTTVRLANISTALTNGWEAGKSYRYRFTMGSSQYILFDGVETVAWQDAEGGSYNVDY